MVKITEALVKRALLIVSITELGWWLLALLCTLVAGALKKIDGFSAGIVLSVVFAFGASGLGVMCTRYRKKELRVFFISGQLVMICMHVWCISLFAVLEWVSHGGGAHIHNLRALDAAMAFVVFSLITCVIGTALGFYYWKREFEDEHRLLGEQTEQEIEESNALL